ncbi:sterol-4-alpha-carboxylate 3-dehydrogenase Erg26p, decarboxylating [Trichomonascus vanleenenianus]|uniref:sterol-4-alpha-carboxylate 3-dehydrogenase (decarboxylating) n=1 Tax=Trichomonascus vanleenenianus TaxID=2268995 RepID=UPI003ECA89E9
MERVLLVGGSGFLGLHLIDRFWAVTPRPEIHVFDIRALPEVSPNFYSFDPSQIKVHIGDLTSEEDVEKVIKAANPDVIVHSASPVHGLKAELYRKVNVDGTKNLVDVARRLGVGAFVYTSSAGVIFNGEDLRNADETMPYPKVPLDAYNETKAQGEMMVQHANSGQFKTVCLRPAGIFGPGDRQMIPALRIMGQRNQHRFQLGDNLNLFDVTYVVNVAHAHVLAAQKLLSDEAAKVAGEIFLITNDSPIYFWSIGKEVAKYDGLTGSGKYVIPKNLAVVIGFFSEVFCKLIGKEPSLTPYRVKTSCATRYYDITKAKTILGYKPLVGLEEGIKTTLQSMDETIGK